MTTGHNFPHSPRNARKTPRLAAGPIRLGLPFVAVLAGLIYWLLGTAGSLCCVAQVDSASRGLVHSFDLADQAWQVSLDGTQTWQPVRIGVPIEDQFSADFDGISWYRVTLDPTQLGIPRDARSLVLRFEAVATDCQVFANGILCGNHLGGWTPFVVPLAPALEMSHRADSDTEPGSIEITVRVDEKVGHNTQGFLPVIAPHFGGIWQGVTLEHSRPIDSKAVPWILNDSLSCWPDANLASLHVHGQLVGWRDMSTVAGILRVRAGGQTFEFQLAPPAAAAIPTESPNDRRDSINNRSQRSSAGSEQHAAAQNGGATDKAPVVLDEQGHFSLQVPLPAGLDLWSPASPKQHELQVDWSPANDANEKQTLRRKFALRKFAAEGKLFLLNDQPIQLRGILNWGYAPPSVAPSLDENWMRREIEFAQARGFNLMKFCLWIPPRRYLELCDEMGMLAWIEYPAWHPQLTPEFLQPLEREYGEFFRHVRPHGSVVLHSLTCETGPSADLAVLTRLYELCKSAVPGAVVEDDSSWISWNRVHDFYDDHPYGNNHTWVATLTRLKSYIAERTEKPLILGEAIAADTWWPTTVASHSLPRHLEPWFAETNRRWVATVGAHIMPQRAAADIHQRLTDDSIRYAHLMRKYQIETYRREAPTSGYVVSVLRDFPKASMGLIDFAEHPKSPADAWSFQRDTMLLLSTADDRRSFASGSTASLPIEISHFGLHLNGGSQAELVVRLRHDRDGVSRRTTLALPRAGELASTEFEFELPEVDEPTPMELEAELVAAGEGTRAQPLATNRWRLWVFPDPQNPSSEIRDAIQLKLHPTVPSQEYAEAFSRNVSQPDFEQQFNRQLENWRSSLPESEGHERQLLLVHRLDSETLAHLEDGGNAILFPDGTPGSMPINPHWFLRGGPVATESLGAGDVPWNRGGFFAELQHFDLAGPVVSQVGPWLGVGFEAGLPSETAGESQEESNPESPVSAQLVCGLWDNHDLRETRTHGQLFWIPVGGRGRLWVCTLNLWGKHNSAGQWMLGQLLHAAAKPAAEVTAETQAAGLANAARLHSEIDSADIELGRRRWKFRPDAEQRGEAAGWYATSVEDALWTEIGIDRHWESQGFAELDGWAWYRLEIEIPEDWSADKAYLNFTGVDDHYRLFVAGKYIGMDGDIEKRQTAFDHRRSWEITEHVRAGEKLTIAIAVYDWFGAGGIFRPVTLSSSPLSQLPPFLKR